MNERISHKICLILKFFEIVTPRKYTFAVSFANFQIKNCRKGGNKNCGQAVLPDRSQ